MKWGGAITPAYPWTNGERAHAGSQREYASLFAVSSRTDGEGLTPAWEGLPNQ
jgi:hypothetical protein